MVICQALGAKEPAAGRCCPPRAALAKEISIATSWGARDKRLPAPVGTGHPKTARGEEGAGGSAPVPSRSHPRLPVPALNPAPKDEKLMLTFPW